MFEIINFDSWKPYEGASEGSGRSEKIWLMSEDGKIGLFKYPKLDPSTSQITTEHVSEHLANQIGKITNIKTADVDLGSYHGRLGSMSYLVTSPSEALIEGINFISGIYPQYNAEQMIDEETGKYYCMEHIFRSTSKFSSPDTWLKMMLFDFLIGNADRHQNNWAILASFSDQSRKLILLKECPLYDNGSSLCCYVNEQQVENYFGKDMGPINALVDSKSKSIIRIDGNNKARPRHSAVVRYLISNFSEAKPIAASFIRELTESRIDFLLSQYPESVLSNQKNLLIRRFLKIKIANLKALLEE